jgi:hypothetical protein
MSPIPPITFVETLASVPDPRSTHGKRYPFVPVLCLVALGLLMGKRTVGSIARLGRLYGPELLLALGFPRGRGPVKSAISRLLRRIDAAALEAALARWVAPRLPEGAAAVVSIDGKTLRGSRDGEVPGVHLVAAYAPEVGAVLGQVRVDAKTNEHKAALELLGILPVKGKIFTGDAMFCQRDFCAAVVEGGGDYVLTAKDNQPSLVIDIQAGLAYQEQARRLPAAFSPRAPAGDAPGRASSHDDRQGARAHREADPAIDDDPDEAAGVGGPEAGLRAGPGADGEGQDDGGGGPRDHQPESRAGRREAAAGTESGPLGDRERAAPRAGRDDGGGPKPGARGRRATGDGGATQPRDLPGGAGGGAKGDPAGGIGEDGGKTRRSPPRSRSHAT